MTKVSVARRIVRAIFIGMTIGMFGFWGVYLMATALYYIAGSHVVSEVGAGLLTFGATVSAAIGAELSKDIAEDQQ